jgi:hypothetical protein
MDGNGGADDARAEHHDIRARQKDLRPSSLRAYAQQGTSAGVMTQRCPL